MYGRFERRALVAAKELSRRAHARCTRRGSSECQPAGVLDAPCLVRVFGVRRVRALGLVHRHLATLGRNLLSVLVVEAGVLRLAERISRPRHRTLVVSHADIRYWARRRSGVSDWRS
eukprot:7077735-Prymnesium_polylepis.1